MGGDGPGPGPTLALPWPVRDSASAGLHAGVRAQAHGTQSAEPRLLTGKPRER